MAVGPTPAWLSPRDWLPRPLSPSPTEPLPPTAPFAVGGLPGSPSSPSTSGPPQLAPSPPRVHLALCSLVPLRRQALEPWGRLRWIQLSPSWQGGGRATQARDGWRRPSQLSARKARRGAAMLSARRRWQPWESSLFLPYFCSLLLRPRSRRCPLRKVLSRSDLRSTRSVVPLTWFFTHLFIVI